MIQVVQRPVLTAKVLGGKIVLAWPTNSAGFAVEYTTNLPAASWVSNSTPATIVNSQYTVTNANAGARQFYRLRK
jgi:hypothetical protein